MRKDEVASQVREPYLRHRDTCRNVLCSQGPGILHTHWGRDLLAHSTFSGWSVLSSKVHLSRNDTWRRGFQGLRYPSLLLADWVGASGDKGGRDPSLQVPLPSYPVQQSSPV